VQKVKIKNRKGQNVVVLLEEDQNPKGLAFIIHGLSGFKEQPHIQTFAKAYKDEGYSIVRFDTTNTFGESDGKYEDATVTSYYEDLEDVIAWSRSQPWFIKPYFLAGHSLGSLAITLYAEKHPEEVKGLAPISTVVSGKLSLGTNKYQTSLSDWKKTGWRIEKHDSVPGLVKKLPWSHMVDRLKYDVLPEANKLTMPVLLIVGDKDDSTPYENQKLLFDLLPGKKEIHIIKDAPHTFHGAKQLDEVEILIKQWLDNF
jgi:pimeloyl-ACP methyl ester carboxylesterase